MEDRRETNNADNTFTELFSSEHDTTDSLYSEMALLDESHLVLGYSDTGIGITAKTFGLVMPVTGVSKIKLAGTFTAKTTKVKIAGTFVEKTTKVKVAGVFI